MSQCYLGFGSNTRREYFLNRGMKALSEHYRIVQVSPVYRSPALGFEGDDFYNFCVEIELDTSVAVLSQTLKRIEDDNERERSQGKYSHRTLDIDILLVDDHVGVFDGVALPRTEIYQNDFVLKPLAEIAGDKKDPMGGGRFSELWLKMMPSSKSLVAVDDVLMGLKSI